MFFDVDGGAEWTGACVDAETGRLYVTANHIGWAISLFRDDDPPYDAKAPKTPGQAIFETTCASCHGTNRLGFGLYPPLRGLRHRLSEEAITRQVREGRNAMPANPQLSVEDMKALVDYRNAKGLARPLIEWKYLLFNWNDHRRTIERAIELVAGGMYLTARVSWRAFLAGMLP